MRSQDALRLVTLLAVALLAGGCLHDDEGSTTVTVHETVTETGTASVPGEAPAVVRVYFLRDGEVAPVQREVVTGPAIARAALNELFSGLSPEERGLETSIHEGVEVVALAIQGGVADIRLSESLNDERAYAQVVYTLTQFPTVKRVVVDGRRPAGRAAVEEHTPPVLVESPLPGETVEPGFEVTGTANTFEATFQYELRDASDAVISKDFVTATSGSGTRGTFSFTVPYEVDRVQEGSLTVFENSAASGARTNEVSIPLRLE